MQNTVSLSEAAVIGRMSPAKMFNALARGEVKGEKGTRGWVIEKVSLDRFLANQKPRRRSRVTN